MCFVENYQYAIFPALWNFNTWEGKLPIYNSVVAKYTVSNKRKDIHGTRKFV